MVNKTPWQQGVSLLVLTTVLSGCAAFGPDHTPATLLTPSQLSLPATNGNMPGQRWWNQLHDETLNALIDDAVAHSPSMQLAQNRLFEARSALGLSQSQMGPRVDLNASDDRQLYSENGLFSTPYGGNYYDNYTLTLNASWEIDFWGKNRAQVRAAVGEAKAAALETQQAQLVLTQAVIGQYTQLQRQLQQKDLIEARIRLANSRIALMQARVHAGLMSPDTVYQAQTSLAGLQAQDAAIVGDIARARHALSTLTGKAPDALDTLTPAKLANTPAYENAQLTLDLLGKRPDIASQREQVEAMQENIKVAKAEFYPNFRLSGFLGVNSLAYSTLFEHASNTADIQPAFTLPIFHSGELQANLHVQQSRYDQAVNSYNQTVLDGLKDAADALSGEQQALTQRQQAHTAWIDSNKAADAMTLRLKAGMVNKLDVLQSQDTALAQKSNELDTLANERIAWAKLNTALGGGIITAPADR